MSATLLSQLATVGSDVKLWYRLPAQGSQASQVQSAPYKLFFKTGNIPLYGRAGTLFWVPASAAKPGAPAPLLDESNTSRRFQLASISDVRAFKQSAVFKSPACDHVSQDVCFSLASSQYELNIAFASPAEREMWWNVILQQLEQNGRKLLSDSPAAAAAASAASAAAPSPSPRMSPMGSSNPSASPPPAGSTGKKLSLHNSPEELARVLAAGSPFRKFDLKPDGSLKVEEVVVFTSGVGRAGLLHWVPASAAAAASQSGAPLQPVPGAHIPLSRITDILMRMKSPALRAAGAELRPGGDPRPPAEEACFALVTEAYTLSLEARSKEQRTQWQEGLISILTNAGKQLQRRATVSAHSSGVAAATSAAASGHHPRASSEDQGRGRQVSAPPESRHEEASLSAGQHFHMYFLHPSQQGVVVKQWVHVWFVEVGSPHPSAPGFLYFSTVAGSRALHDAQRFPLNTITEMIGSNKVATVWRVGVGTQAVNELCATITGSNLVWNLELIPPPGASIPAAKEIRDTFLRNIHAIMVRFRRNEAAAAQQGVLSPSSVSALGVSSPSASSPPPVAAGGGASAVAAQQAEDMRMLREGQNFLRHTASTRGSGQEIENKPVLLWLVEEGPGITAPGCLYFNTIPGAKLVGPDTGRLPLATIQTMAAGKESALFKLASARSIQLDRCMSLVSASLTLDLEAPAFEVREKWIRALHGLMVRHGRRATEQRAQGTGAGAPSPMSVSASGSRGSVSQQAAAAPSPSSSPSHSSLSSSSLSSGVPSVPTDDPHIALLQSGATFAVLYTTPRNEVLSADISLFLLIQAVAGSSGPFPELAYATSSLQWCNPAQKKVVDGQRLSSATIIEVRRGKEVSGPSSVVWRSELAKNMDPSRCFNIIGVGLTLNLVAKEERERDAYALAIEHLLAKVRAARGRASVSIGPPTPSPSHSASSANQSALSPDPLRRAASSPSTPAAAAALDTPAEQNAFLATPQRFFLYSVRGPNGLVEERSDVVAWVVPESAQEDSKLHWVPFGSRMDPSASCTVLLPTIIDVQAASDASASSTAPLRSPFCRTHARLDLDSVLLVTHATPGPAGVLFFEAASPDKKAMFIRALTGAVERVGPGKKHTMYNTMVASSNNANQAAAASASAAAASSSHARPAALDSSAPVHPNPMSPNSPASPASGSLRAAMGPMDHRSAVALLTNGQPFVMYSGSAGSGDERMENVFIYFVASNGVDSPGTLHWTRAPAPGQALVKSTDKSRIFYLNQIKQMRAGKETPIFKSASGGAGGMGIAAHANVNHCLSLFSTSTVWNLEAPSAEVREMWMKSLHQVLVRHGMKAVDEDKKKAQAAQAAQAQAQAAAAVASKPNSSSYHAAIAAAQANPGLGGPPPQASSSSSSGFSSETRALPTRGADAPNLNRTIAFSDPTEHFQLVSKIGEGSYGAVYKALDHRDGRFVAIKVLQFNGRDSLKLRKEIHILKQCDSPFIVGYKGAFQKASNVWIVMEYCAAGALSDIMQICNRTFSEAQVALIMKHALAGLAYLHSEEGGKRIHRDIKGGNILVDQRGMCKLADFGVSSNLDKTLGKNRTVIGTPHWMAPEVLTNDDYNEKADVWSLGITAYELAIGEPPHSKLHSMRAAIKIPTSPPPTLPDPARFSSDFHSFLAACLVKDFETRPSAASLLSHPFIQKAPPESILMENVRAAMAELESKHENLDEINGLMNSHTIRGSGSSGSIANTGDNKKSMRGVSSTRDSRSRTSDTLDPADLDGDFGGGDFGSDTMVQAGGGGSDTMVRATPLDEEEDDANATMIMGGAPVASPTSSSSRPAAAAAAVAAAASYASPSPSSSHSHASDSGTMIFGTQTLVSPSPVAIAEDPSEEGLSQFSDDDDDDGDEDDLPELRITEEGDAQ